MQTKLQNEHILNLQRLFASREVNQALYAVRDMSPADVAAIIGMAFADAEWSDDKLVVLGEKISAFAWERRRGR